LSSQAAAAAASIRFTSVFAMKLPDTRWFSNYRSAARITAQPA
jgi:hypothetical protein